MLDQSAKIKNQRQYGGNKQISEYANKQMNGKMPNSSNEKKQYAKDIHERIYEFVIRVINITKILPKTPQNEVIIYQLTKSATSMGANDQEADGAESKKDFISKYTIVKKENKETNYWLRLIFDTNPEIAAHMVGLREEGLEILRIISAIILNSKRNI